MLNYIQISFPVLNDEQKEILIALLADAGFEGFEEVGNGLEAFVNESKFNRIILTEIAHQYKIEFIEKTISPANWNKLWESGSDPVIIENFCAVRASFHNPVKTARYEIIIDPKMNFGTGHHATTFMMIQQMSEIDFTGKTVCDFGTGTGILAILSEKLGTENIIAIENDLSSIENARENILLNKCSNIRLLNDSKVCANQKFDIILANINKNTILENFSSFHENLNANGVLLLSGFLEEDLPEILLAASDFEEIKTILKDNWVCVRFKPCLLKTVD
ncbi:MAG TPA: 50S ribosomal protein L11 methyltransferase [Chitinophagaceae bacterium]|nr:50S ribosomal protein L11 methyltransferase [Chitinophagaceae bacterium]